MIVDAHLLALQTGELHDRGLRQTWDLRADPDVATVLCHLHGAVHRFHRGVRKKGLLVDRLDFPGGTGNDRSGVTIFASDDATLFRGGTQAGRRCQPWRASRSIPHPTAARRPPAPAWPPTCGSLRPP